VERIPAVVYNAAYGSEGAWLYITPQIEQLMGFTPDEWLAHPSPQGTFTHPDDLPGLLEEEQRYGFGRQVRALNAQAPGRSFPLHPYRLSDQSSPAANASHAPGSPERGELRLRLAPGRPGGRTGAGMHYLLKISRAIDVVNGIVGRALGWVAIALILLGVINVLGRYLGARLGMQLSSNMLLEAQTQATVVLAGGELVEVETALASLKTRASTIGLQLSEPLILASTAPTSFKLQVQGPLAELWPKVSPRLGLEDYRLDGTCHLLAKVVVDTNKWTVEAMNLDLTDLAIASEILNLREPKMQVSGEAVLDWETGLLNLPQFTLIGTSVSGRGMRTRGSVRSSSSRNEVRPRMYWSGLRRARSRRRGLKASSSSAVRGRSKWR
jgi:hypothetical protein